jgi:hypothetical protein
LPSLVYGATCPTPDPDLSTRPADRAEFRVRTPATSQQVSGSEGDVKNTNAFSLESDYVDFTWQRTAKQDPSNPACFVWDWVKRATPTPVESDVQVLVAIWGDLAYSHGTISYSDENGNIKAPLSVSATPLSVTGLTTPSIPSGNTGGYFIITIPSGDIQSKAFTYRSTKNGTITFRALAKFSLKGIAGTLDTTSSTSFRPRLKFATAPNNVRAGDCSPAMTVMTVDGNGNEVATSKGVQIKILLSAAPADIFLDDECTYPTAYMFVNNPVPTSSGSRPPTTISTSRVTFYLMTKQAQPLPVTAKFTDSIASQIQTVTSLPPVASQISGPTATNQGECSEAIQVKLIDIYGNEATVLGSPRTFALQAAGGAAFYSDAGCGSRISKLSFPVGVSQAKFYLRDGSAEEVKVSLADTAPAGSAIQGSKVAIKVLGVGNMAIADTMDQARTIAKKLYARLAGLPISLDDPNLEKMAKLILGGKMLDAAHIATDQASFYGITLKNMVTPLSTRLLDSLTELNDFVTTWIGIVRDGHDARELLTGNHIYVPSTYRTGSEENCASSIIYEKNTPFSSLDPMSLKSTLVPVRECAYNSDDFSQHNPVLLNDAAGLLTTRQWGMEHLFMGTNRRGIQYAFLIFGCKSMADLQDNSMPDWHIRRDVDRAPGGDPKVYQASCRSCHGGLDSLGGAYAFFDSYFNEGDKDDFRLFYVNKGGYGEDAAMPKMNKNSDVFPPGWVTGDDTWINTFVENRNKSIGWSTEIPLKGNGIHAFGEMLANSQAFPACMAQRVFKEVCKRDARPDEAPVLNDLSNDFQASGYNMRRLFEKAASQTACIGDGE